MPDFGPAPCFQLKNSLLLQYDVRDINGKLVAPWDFHKVLRPGTVVLADSTLHCFVMPNKPAPGEAVRKVRFRFVS
jgi:hypothetical protein